MKNNNMHNEIDIDNLLCRLKNEDSNYSKLSRRVQILYIVLAIIYGILTIIHLVEEFNYKNLVSGLSYLGSFLIFILVFGKYYKDYKNVNYSEPTLIMLKKAAYRYQPFQKITVWVLLGLILMDIGLCYNTSLNFPILKTQFYYWGVIIVAVVIGLIINFYKYKPLRDGALSLIKEIEAE